MLVSLNWLKNYVDYGDQTPEVLAEKITKSGIEVDGIEYIVSEKSTNVVVGYVQECEQHPNADKLKLCQVDVGESEPLQIICGAPNVAQGQKVVVAKPGGVLPGNFKIKKVKLRGIESNGMICSMSELGVDEKHIPEQFKEGIIELNSEATIGEGVDELLNLNDVILEFDLTPNRSDALSMIGVAYEVAAILDIEMNLPQPVVDTANERANEVVRVSVEDEKICPYYGAYVLTDMTVKPSPLWMQQYLLAAGIRPINNVVDITNYVLLEYGQPLHAFDRDLIETDEIVVRKAKKEEKIVTLDNQERTMNDEHLLITDGTKGIALAGVMGGADTEVNEITTNVLLETAYFDPKTVRKAVMHTGLRSEASTRFEKGVDPNRVKEAGLRACELMAAYADAKVFTGVAEADYLDKQEKSIVINAKDVNKHLGTNITISELEYILAKLRFPFTVEGELFTVSIPTRRGDIHIFEDMLEEIARIYGYDLLPYTLPANASKAGGLTESQKLQRKIKQFFKGTGFSEAITYALVHERATGKFMSPEQEQDLIPIALSMPMSEDHQYLRQSLIPELLNRLAYNTARKQTDIALFETGSVFLTKEKQLTEQPHEQLRLTGAATGNWVSHPWQGENKEVDFFVIKGVLEELFRYLNKQVSFEQAVLPDMHPGRCATINVDGNTIGFLGQVHPSYAKSIDLKATYIFDLNLEYLLKASSTEIEYQQIAKYPSILRDIAFVMDESVLAGNIKEEIKMIGSPLVKKVEVFDVYTGDHLDSGKKSVAYNIHYQDKEKTLTDTEVDQSLETIISTINNKYGTYVRS
ncbi:MAG TPA: phenylalanine--tRNA ligase subunit beta [Pseudogracilibacillus sp.]|nr:phenylalanine--tRNA ligase subunit beta [Pseudogracilibacillus sp.]